MIINTTICTHRLICSLQRGAAPSTKELRKQPDRSILVGVRLHRVLLVVYSNAQLRTLLGSH